MLRQIILPDSEIFEESQSYISDNFFGNIWDGSGAFLCDVYRIKAEIYQNLTYKIMLEFHYQNWPI